MSDVTKRILVPGTVLVDKYADTGECFLGGAEFNFAHHVHQLMGGLDFVARVGEDENGQFILKELAHRGFPTHLIQVDAHKPTKTVTITKNDKNEPVYDIASNVASEYLEFPKLSTDEIADYALVYFGTTLQYAEKSRNTLRRILKQSQGIGFCDLNLRPGKYTPEVLEYSLHACDFLKINHEELDVISELFDLKAPDLEARVLELSTRFDIPGICVTRAEQGSVLYRNRRFWQKSLAPITVVDTVGAGDAFSACLAIGLLQRWDSQTMLDRASELAGAICQLRGAVPGENAFYLPFIKNETD